MPTGISSPWGYSPENVGGLYPSFDTGYNNNNLYRNNLTSIPIKFDKKGNLIYPYSRQTTNYYTKNSTNNLFGKKSKSTQKKYTKASGRKSPGVSAKDVPVGKKSKGLDGKIWITTRNKNGIHRWVHFKK